MSSDNANGQEPRPPDDAEYSRKRVIRGRIVAVLLLIVVGIVYFFVIRPAQSLAENHKAIFMAEVFLGLLQKQDTAGAYQETSQRYQDVVSLDQFEKIVAQFPILTGHSSRGLPTSNRLLENGVELVQAHYTLTGSNTSSTSTIVLVQENGRWVVDSITVP